MLGACCGLPSLLTNTLLQSLDVLDASKKRLSSRKNKLTNFSRFLVLFYIFVTGIPQVLEQNRHFAFKRDSEVGDGFLQTSTLYCTDSPVAPNLTQTTQYILIAISALPQLTDLLPESDVRRGRAICSSEVVCY